jgi:hypothetical protein
MTKILSPVTLCPDRESNQTFSKVKFRTLPLDQTVRSFFPLFRLQMSLSAPVNPTAAWEADNFSGNREFSLLCLQKPANGPYPEPK